VRIHVERAIGRIKQYKILHGVIPISSAGISNNVACVCAYLTNFLPPVVGDSGDNLNSLFNDHIRFNYCNLLMSVLLELDDIVLH
jgi:hypothetical protein